MNAHYENAFYHNRVVMHRAHFKIPAHRAAHGARENSNAVFSAININLLFQLLSD